MLAIVVECNDFENPKTRFNIMLKDVNEFLERDEMTLSDWEGLLNSGWDRVGSFFFHRRFDVFQSIFEDNLTAYQLMPLRYNLTDFSFSKSQRIIKRRNEDLRRVFRPAFIDDEKLTMFDNWYSGRFFTEGSIFTWVSGTDKPFPTYEVALYKGDKLVACSFFDITPSVQYSTLAMYDHNEKHRSLGTYTLISEVEFAIENHKMYHYPGHAYAQKSVYDYKKKYNNMENYDWETSTWQSLDRII